MRVQGARWRSDRDWPVVVSLRVLHQLPDGVPCPHGLLHPTGLHVSRSRCTERSLVPLFYRGFVLNLSFKSVSVNMDDRRWAMGIVVCAGNLKSHLDDNTGYKKNHEDHKIEKK